MIRRGGYDMWKEKEPRRLARVAVVLCVSEDLFIWPSSVLVSLLFFFIVILPPEFLFITLIEGRGFQNGGHYKYNI